MQKIYFATIALESGRRDASDWKPTFRASDFVNRISQDGFSGVELWEKHYLRADEAEKERLIRSNKINIYNTYLSFEKDSPDYEIVAKAICDIQPEAIKFNFGGYENVKEQKERLLRFADMLPEKTRLLCECHRRTMMEKPEIAGQMFRELDERFGAIVHLADPMELIKASFEHYGDRICHVHINRLLEHHRKHVEEGGADLRTHWAYMKQCGFSGTVSIEFTMYGDTEEETYQNAIRDMNWLREQG